MSGSGAFLCRVSLFSLCCARWVNGPLQSRISCDWNLRDGSYLSPRSSERVLNVLRCTLSVHCRSLLPVHTIWWMVHSSVVARYVIISKWTKGEQQFRRETWQKTENQVGAVGAEKQAVIYLIILKYCLDVKHYKGAEYKGGDSNWERSCRGGGRGGGREGKMWRAPTAVMVMMVMMM